MFHHTSILRLLKLFLFFDFLFSMYRSIDHLNTFLGWHWRDAGWPQSKRLGKEKMDIFPMVCRPMTNCWMAGPSLLFTGCHLRIHPRKISFRHLEKSFLTYTLLKVIFFIIDLFSGRLPKINFQFFIICERNKCSFAILWSSSLSYNQLLIPKQKWKTHNATHHKVGNLSGLFLVRFEHLQLLVIWKTHPPPFQLTCSLDFFYYNSPTIEGLMNVGCLFCCLVIFDDTLRQTNSEFAPKM